jgi:cellulose synthase operon protein C
MLAVTILGLPHVRSARADVGDRLPRLSRLRRDVEGAPGPRVYAALRRVWQEWDQGDPAEVEEILREVSASTRVAPPARAYAGLLVAYARRRRGDLDGARARVAELGYVSRWLVAGPFDNEGKAGLMRPLGPDEDQSEPLNLGRTYDGKERPVRWRALGAQSLTSGSGATSGVTSPAAYGWTDFGVLLRPTAKICAFVTTFVHDADPRRSKIARPISIWAGSAGAMRVYWNGEEVIRDEKYRDLDADRFAARVTMRAGYNRLTAKVCGDDDAPIFSLRLASADGAPDKTIETDPDPSHATRVTAAATREARGARRGNVDAAPTPAMEGPVPTFERMTKGGTPEVLEAYARYLVLTQSDDPSEKRARELARKAAETAPTIARLLLAGDLSEGRNQRALWVERAEALAKKGATTEEQIDVLIARAMHARSGVNWRDAVPYFDRVLAIDPDNVPATLARVELYGEAGLRETALAFLERALARRPRSVALVRAMVAALREQDRTTEADEVQERYTALRFDDLGFLRGQVELAVARRDLKSAARWIDRLLSTSPDNSESLATAARAMVALGDRAAAIAMYRRALALAPEDTDTMRALADVYAVGGQTQEQLALLRKVVELKPQEKEVRDYLAHTEPSKPRPDEAYARPTAEFLKLRDRPDGGRSRRTLVDLQVTTVYPNGLASRFHQVVFQPLTDAAAATAREYAFGFQADSETVQIRGAHVYRANGKTDEAIEMGDGPADDPSIATYTSARAYYVHFPRLFPGDVVELQYRVEDVAPRNAFADYFGEVADLQSSEPLARAEYVLITPKARTFYFNTPRVPGLTRTVEEKGDARVYHFTALDVPPIEPEALQPPYGELLGHVHVSTYKTWDDVGRWYWGLVRDQFVADDEVRRRAAEITKGLTSERDKVRAVYDYVVQKTRYVALEFGIHGFKPYRCAQIFARGFGDCKDKATLIVTMLKVLGIDATIVIVRTGHRGDFETEPASLAPFDHAIAYVPSLDLYLDGTAEFTGSTELPTMDRGALALQINEGKPKLVHLPDPPAAESVGARRLELTLGAEGNAQIDWRIDVAGAGASAWRGRYHAEATRRARLQEDIGGELPGIDIGDVATSNLEDVEQRVGIRVKGKAPKVARRDGDAYSVPAGPHEHMVRDYAALSQRRLDVKLGARTASDNEWIVHLPAGAKITSAPKPAHEASRFGTAKVDVETTGSTVRVKTSVAITTSRIAASDYAAFRAWCEAVDRALGQRVVYTAR